MGCLVADRVWIRGMVHSDAKQAVGAVEPTLTVEQRVQLCNKVVRERGRSLCGMGTASQVRKTLLGMHPTRNINTEACGDC